MQKVSRNGTMGDHVVTLRIQVPTNLSREQSAALKRYAELRGEWTSVI